MSTCVLNGCHWEEKWQNENWTFLLKDACFLVLFDLTNVALANMLHFCSICIVISNVMVVVVIIICKMGKLLQIVIHLYMVMELNIKIDKIKLKIHNYHYFFVFKLSTPLLLRHLFYNLINSSFLALVVVCPHIYRVFFIFSKQFVLLK